jgi:hypothetical protein
MTNANGGVPNLVAVFPVMEDARKGISALELAGIDGSLISLIGPKAEESADVAATQVDVSSRDSDVAGDVAKSAAVGSAVGGATGFLAGLAAFAIPGVGPVVGAGIWLAGLVGAIGGASVGGVAGGVSALPVSRDWELARESLQLGRTLVGVHSDAPEELDRAEAALRESGAVRVERVRQNDQGRAAA